METCASFSISMNKMLYKHPVVGKLGITFDAQVTSPHVSDITVIKWYKYGECIENECSVDITWQDLVSVIGHVTLQGIADTKLVGALSPNQATSTHLKIGNPWTMITFTRSSAELPLQNMDGGTLTLTGVKYQVYRILLK